ncbi:MAG: DUF1772 domain-containing protein [Nitrospirae bacterium]|nr:DUF1772 domain-containing protein [Nitrospirota bacterium]
MTIFPPLIFIAVLLSGIIAGVFFTFSTFVMPALSALPSETGIASMQSINVSVVKSLFIIVFMGITVLSIALGVMAILKWGQPGMSVLLAASIFNVVGSFLVTMAFNVPLNEALAAVVPQSVEGAEMWTRYLHDWTLWNHVRTISTLLASGGFMYTLINL